MSSRRIIQGIKYLLAALVIGTPLFYWKWSLSPYIIPKTIFFQAVVELIVVLWLALAISDKRYQPRPRMTPLAWVVAAYLCILAITAFMGVDAWRSFFSDLARGFGIVMYIHLAALALVVSSLFREIPWKKIWYASFATSLIIVAVEFIQLQAPSFLLSGDLAANRPGATFGNPTFLAGYLLFIVFLAGYFLMEKFGRARVADGQFAEKYFLGLVVVVNIVGIFITATRGDIFGLFAGAFALIALFAWYPPASLSSLSSSSQKPGAFSRRSFYVLLLAIFIIAGAGVWFTRSSAVWDNVPGLDRLKNLTLSGANSDIVPREIASEAAWKGFLERPLTGWGFENFNVVFNENYNPKILEYGTAESDFDKPHDIVLEELDAGGILLLLAYLAVLMSLIYEARKLKDPLIFSFVCAAVAAYFVRSLVIFDTIGPAMMLYLLAGFIDGKYRMATGPVLPPGPGSVAISDRKQRRQDRQEQRERGVSGGMVAAVLIPAAIVVYALNGTAFAAGSLAWQAHEDLQLANDPAGGLAAFSEEASAWNVYQWDFIRDYANTVANAYFDNESAVPKTDVQNAIALMNQVALAHPNDAYNHYLLTEIYNLAYDIDPQDYGKQAEAQGQIALQLSPGRQEIYFDLIKTKSLEGDNAGALVLAKTALDLDPNVPAAHFYYGILAFANGDTATGYSEVEAAIALDYQWASYNEPEVAGDYFAGSGHLPQAIGLYQAALSLDPTDYSAEAKLGAAYYLSGDVVSAKKYLSDAVTHVDLSSSPAYAQYQPILRALGIQ